MSLWLSRDNSRNEIYDLRFLHLLVSRDIHLECDLDSTRFVNGWVLP